MGGGGLCESILVFCKVRNSRISLVKAFNNSNGSPDTVFRANSFTQGCSASLHVCVRDGAFDGCRQARGCQLALWHGSGADTEPSTVVDFTAAEPRVLRSGPVAWEEG